MRLTSLAVAATVLAAGFAATGPAEARIRCSGPNQIIKGIGEVPTPFCEDENLAQVARAYGMGISGQAIRASYTLKKHVCNQIGYDIRVQNTCSGLRYEPGGKRNVVP